MPLDRTAFYADSSTALSLATITANMADAEADEIAKRPYLWANSAARTGQTGMAAGDIGYQVDVSTYYTYSGSAWVRQDGRIIPTSVQSGSFNADTGVVTSSAVTRCRLRTVFPSDFRVFRVVFDVTTSAAVGVNYNLAVDGTDATSGYDNQRQTAINTTGAAFQSLNGSDGWLSGIGVAGRHFGSFIITDPNVAGPTYVDASSMVSSPGAMTTSQGRSLIGSMHRTATAYNSLAIYVGSGNATLNRVTVEGVS